MRRRWRHFEKKSQVFSFECSRIDGTEKWHSDRWIKWQDENSNIIRLTQSLERVREPFVCFFTVADFLKRPPDGEINKWIDMAHVTVNDILEETRWHQIFTKKFWLVIQLFYVTDAWINWIHVHFKRKGRYSSCGTWSYHLKIMSLTVIIDSYVYTQGKFKPIFNCIKLSKFNII